MLSEDQIIQNMYDSDRVDSIIGKFRQKKRASKKDTSSLEDKLIGEWNSNYKVSKEDYSSILKQNAKYLVDYVTDDIAGKVSEHLLTEIEILSEIGLTKKQTAKSIRKNSIYTIDNIVKKEEWPIAIRAIYSRNARLKASELKRKHEEIRDYMESKTDWRTAKTIANRARTRDTADRYLQKYNETLEHAKNLGYKKRAKTIASQAFTAKDHITKTEELAHKYDKSITSKFQAGAIYQDGNSAVMIDIREYVRGNKKEFKVFTDTQYKKVNLENPLFFIEDKTRNKGFELVKEALSERKNNIFDAMREKVNNSLKSSKIKNILQKHGYNQIGEIVSRRCLASNNAFSILRDLKYFKDSKNLAKRYVDETTAENIAAAVMNMQPFKTVENRIREANIEKTNVPSLPQKHIQDTLNGVSMYKGFQQYCQGKNKEFGENFAFTSLKYLHSLEKDKLKRAGDFCLNNYDQYLSHFGKKESEKVAKIISYYLSTKQFNEKTVGGYERCFLDTLELVKNKIIGIDEEQAKEIAGRIFSKNLDEKNADGKIVHFRSIEKLGDTREQSTIIQRKFFVSPELIEREIEKYRNIAVYSRKTIVQNNIPAANAGASNNNFQVFVNESEFVGKLNKKKEQLENLKRENIETEMKEESKKAYGGWNEGLKQVKEGVRKNKELINYYVGDSNEGGQNIIKKMVKETINPVNIEYTNTKNSFVMRNKLEEDETISMRNEREREYEQNKIKKNELYNKIVENTKRIEEDKYKIRKGGIKVIAETLGIDAALKLSSPRFA